MGRTLVALLALALANLALASVDITNVTATPKAVEKIDQASLHRIPVFEDKHPIVETIHKLEAQLKDASTTPVVATESKPEVTTVTEEVPIPKIDPAYLHRIPVFEDKHPIPETISKLEAQLKNPETQEPVTTEASGKDKTNATKPELNLEVPIPSRCPQITGTAGTQKPSSDLNGLLGGDQLARDMQRGCRFFIMHELMDRDNNEHVHAGLEEQLKATMKACYESCTQAYGNETKGYDHCSKGCIKAAEVTEAFKKTTTEAPEDELEHEDNGTEPGLHRSFSIIVPLRPVAEESEGANPSSDPFPSMMPNAIRMVLGMMHQMAERARQQMMQTSGGQEVAGTAEDTTGGDGNSISVSRSMSVIVTKDKDGHSKMVVVHTLPKIQIHRFGHGVFGSDEDDDVARRIQAMVTGKDPASASAASDQSEDDLFGEDDTDDLRLRFSGHLTGGSHKLSGQSVTDRGSLEGAETETEMYFYRARLCALLPRLFFITVGILVLYLLFWFCCGLPAAMANQYRAAQGQVAGASPVAIIGNGKRRQMIFSKSARYFQLNNKRSSLPPPYQPFTDAEAAPLPEKQPLPEGGEVAEAKPEDK